MPHLEVIWTDGPDENITHLAEHDVTPEEAEEILRNPAMIDISRTSGRSIAMGYTRAGRRLAVIYVEVDPITVYPITAYDI